MNKETIKVVNIGKPDIEAMSGSEQNTFFSELLTKISLLSKQQRAEKSVQRRWLCRIEAQKYTTTEVTT